MIQKVSAEDIAIRGNGTGLEYMCPTWHFVYIFFNPVFQVSTAKNEINLFNNHILIVAPVTFAPAGAMTPSAEFLFCLHISYYRNYPKYWYTLTPYHTCPKIWTSPFYYLVTLVQIAGCVANSVNPHPMPQNVASDQGLHCLLRPVCLNTGGKYSIL